MFAAYEVSETGKTWYFNYVSDGSHYFVTAIFFTHFIFIAKMKIWSEAVVQQYWELDSNLGMSPSAIYYMNCPNTGCYSISHLH